MSHDNQNYERPTQRFPQSSKRRPSETYPVIGSQYADGCRASDVEVKRKRFRIRQAELIQRFRSGLRKR